MTSKRADRIADAVGRSTGKGIVSVGKGTSAMYKWIKNTAIPKTKKGCIGVSSAIRTGIDGVCDEVSKGRAKDEVTENRRVCDLNHGIAPDGTAMSVDERDAALAKEDHNVRYGPLPKRSQ